MTTEKQHENRGNRLLGSCAVGSASGEGAEELFQAGFVELEGAFGAGGKEAFDEFLFVFLHGDDAFFDGAFGDELVDEDGVVLADAVGAVSGLAFDCRVPPRVVVNDCICLC